MTSDNSDFEIITVTDDDGCELELIVVDAIFYENETYLLCVENNEDVYKDSDEEIDAFIFKEKRDPDGDSVDAILQPIEDDEEYERIIKLFENDDYELIE